MNQRDPRTITIDELGVEWAFNMGAETRERARGVAYATADKLCPFREGTWHKRYWYQGWKTSR